MSAIYEFKQVQYIASARNPGDQPTAILTDATFEIERGVFAVITGPSGAGKTTLLRLFNRLADISSGRILFEGKDIREHPVLELRKRIGWVPQVPVRFPGSIEANLKVPFTIRKDRKHSPEEISERIEELKSLNLIPAEIFSREAVDLSVGEAQRLNLLRALALNPDVLLLDEPTSALDPDAASALLDQITRIQRDRNLTAIMVSHRPDEVGMISGKVLRIRDRVVESSGT